MSDRSGVGAPTQDGADPDPKGQDAEPEADGIDALAEDGGSTAAKVRRLLTKDLFGVALGADAATDTPPGVPAPAVDGGSAPTEPTSRPRRRSRQDLSTGASAATATAKTVGADPATEASTSTKASPTAKAGTAAKAGSSVAASPLDDVSTPEVIDSSVDPGVVAVAEPERPSRRGGLRARRVHRIIRRVDPWSVLKLSLLFYFCVWVMVVVSGVLIWGVAVGSGTIENLEGFIERLLSFEEFHFNADQIFRLFAMGGLIMVFLATAISAVLAVLFNLISDLIGGIRITVVEEESTRRIVHED